MTYLLGCVLTAVPAPNTAREAADIVHNNREPQIAMASTERVMDAWDSVTSIAAVPGDIVEAGVYKGGTSMVMAWAELGVRKSRESSARRHMWLFDTFEGLPPPSAKDDARAHAKWNKPIPNDTDTKRAFDTGQPHMDSRGIFRWNYGPLDQVKRNFFSTGYPRHLTHFIQGKVEDTLPSLQKSDELPKKIGLLRLDTDFYESTRAELAILYPRLVRGGILILDDYCTWRGARRAFDEFLVAHRRELNITAGGHSRNPLCLKAIRNGKHLK
mmetsp:Transcript_24411/g.49538  ORF Transcript_24411/g.49538 Transcript_24411/m.49538 type:complete len:271 (+) Transcript_24411:105-917(+)|eukprot:CAMPEP_0119093420 /NCGR_PEP_ID=MMETSP1178-20130426/163071_1 /TAXON_ID=33656 /ORGANISM="unid sp, Strain CCMP2000" /LENGTH=270 /DNA_ID=CAMNT_0007077073 /DNA_START=105 /DNA_END=920 /DNA_ORIENTATION=+